jgi:hypothetical protein
MPSTATFGVAAGLSFQGVVQCASGSPNIFLLAGVDVAVRVAGDATGNVNTALGLRCGAPTYAGNMTIDLSQGIQIANYGQSECTESVALDIAAQSGSTTNWSIRVAGVAPSYHAPAMKIGAAEAPGTTILHVNQSSSSGARPVMMLDQEDIDDTFIDFIGTSAADGTRSISSDTTENSAKFGAVRVEINGTTKWIRIYDDES